MKNNVNINGLITGKCVTFSINGNLNKKTFDTVEEARELFQLVLKAKANPTNENIDELRGSINELRRTAIMAGIEYDENTGKCYMEGFNTPIPEQLLDVIKDYNENNYPLESIFNFWKLLMSNPDTHIRESLFRFIQTHDFVLTDKGYFLTYKAVYRKDINKINNSDAAETDSQKLNNYYEFILNRYYHVKGPWKSSPKNYVVYTVDGSDYKITEFKTANKFDLTTDRYKIFGNLEDLYNVISKLKYDAPAADSKTARAPIYTDMYSLTMSIEIGKPVKMKRKECDGDPEVECSYGLHVGATKYVEHYANNRSVILACLVNPANVVAVPKHDSSKIRVSEYFPFAIATFDKNTKKIDIVEQKYFEDDYCSYEVDELENQIALIKEKQSPIENAISSEPENRPMSELMKIISTRLIDLSE